LSVQEEQQQTDLDISNPRPGSNHSESFVSMDDRMTAETLEFGQVERISFYTLNGVYCLFLL